jgi:ubiquinone/menaquinone biosynthesis C-methylase UbiE
MSAVGRLKRPIFQAASRYCRVAGLASSTNGVHAEAEADFGYRRVPKGEKKGMVGEVFSGVARKYDVMNDLMSGGLHRVWKDDFVAGLRLREAFEAGYVPPAILDLAGGTGDIAFRMLDSLSPYLLEEEKQSHGSPPSQQQQQQQQQQKQRALVTVSDINADMLQVIR